jgi:hypothetical protein
MATKTITIPAKDVTVGDRIRFVGLPVNNGEPSPLTVEKITTDDDGGRVLHTDDGRAYHAVPGLDAEVELPRPHRYAVKTVTSPSTGNRVTFTIIDLHNQARLALDVDGEARVSYNRPTIALWRDLMNFAHHLGIEL